MSETLPPGAEELLGDASSPVRPLKRAEFECLDKQGFFEDERVELLYGMVVAMSPVDRAHASSLRLLHELLLKRLGQRATVDNQTSFAASDVSVPQPDLCVTPPGVNWSEIPDRAYLVVEIARSSLRRDRAKRRLYAQANVEEYWVVNHSDGCIEVYRDRRGNDWQTVSLYRRGETVQLLAFPDVVVAVDDVLPPLES